MQGITGTWVASASCSRSSRPSPGFFASRNVGHQTRFPMVSLNVAATWTRMLSVTAGACSAAGAPGPGTRIRGRPALDWISGPWLGLVDFDGLGRPEREVLQPWLFGAAEPLLLVRHLLLAK